MNYTSSNQASIQVVPSRATHIGPIASRIRAIDRTECEAMGHSPKKALRDGFLYSDMCWTALVDGRPEAMYGVITTSAIEGRAVVWFLGTDEVYRHGRALLALGPRIIARLVDSIGTAGNLVSCQNRQAITLLKRWGFTVEDEISVISGVAFRQFWIDRHV